MRHQVYDRIEQQILNSDSGGMEYRWKWGHTVLRDPQVCHPNGRFKDGELDRMVAWARTRGYKASRREFGYRKQFAQAYRTEAEFAQLVAQIGCWRDLIQAGFPPVEVPVEEPLFDVPEDAEGAPAPADTEPYDPRAPYQRRDDALRHLGRLMDSPEMYGQEPLIPLAGLRTFLPGFSPDTVGRDTVFSEAFKISRYIRDEVTPQLRRAADRATAEDDERDAKLNRLFAAAGRNMAATLGEGDDAYWAAHDE